MKSATINKILTLILCIPFTGVIQAQKMSFGNYKYSIGIHASFTPFGLLNNGPAKNVLIYGIEADKILGPEYSLFYKAGFTDYRAEYRNEEIGSSGEYGSFLYSNWMVTLNADVSARVLTQTFGYNKYSTAFGYMAPFGNYISKGISFTTMQYSFSNAEIKLNGAPDNGRYILNNTKVSNRYLGFYFGLGRRLYPGKKLKTFIDVSLISEIPLLFPLTRPDAGSYMNGIQRDYNKQMALNAILRVKFAYGFSF